MHEIQSSDAWLKHMRAGAFEDAWRISDNILRIGHYRDNPDLPRHFQCIWDGSSPEGKRVLVRCYHGLGDTIQFIRYAPLLRKTASKVIVWAQPRLIELLGTAEGIDDLLPLHDGIPEALYDMDVEIMELPHIFRTTLSTIPSIVPYFKVQPLKIVTEKDRLSVGLVWQAGDWDADRGIPFSSLKPLAEIKGVSLIILQDKAAEAGWEEGFGIHPGTYSLFGHAQIIKGLDLMITIDSMPAHLAGALNVPVWVMIRAEADWRWMADREDSPWYPSMKLFRQKKPGEWGDVIHRVTEELKRLSISAC